MATTKEKVAVLGALVGDNALLEQLLTGATQTEKAAEAQGVTFKEAVEAVATLGTMTKEQATEKLSAFLATFKADGDEGTVAEPVADESAASTVDDDTKVSDMTLGDLMVEVRMEIDAAIKPLIDALGTVATVATTATEATTKAADEQKLVAQQLAAAAEQSAKDIATLKEQLALAEQNQAATTAKLKELEGEQPRSLQTLRASGSVTTIVPESSALKEQKPTADPFNDFWGEMFPTGQA